MQYKSFTSGSIWKRRSSFSPAQKLTSLRILLKLVFYLIALLKQTFNKYTWCPSAICLLPPLPGKALKKPQTFIFSKKNRVGELAMGCLAKVFSSFAQAKSCLMWILH